MTPAQLRVYSTVVRLGSVHAAAAELGMSDVSMHIAQLRKELDDPLFTSTSGGLSLRRADCCWPAARWRSCGLQASHTVDIALGPPVDGDTSMLVARPFLRYQILTVASARSPLAGLSATLPMLRDQP